MSKESKGWLSGLFGSSVTDDEVERRLNEIQDEIRFAQRGQLETILSDLQDFSRHRFADTNLGAWTRERVFDLIRQVEEAIAELDSKSIRAPGAHMIYR